MIWEIRNKALEKFPEKECQIKILFLRALYGDKKAEEVLFSFSQGLLPGPRYKGWGMYS